MIRARDCAQRIGVKHQLLARIVAASLSATQFTVANAMMFGLMGVGVTTMLAAPSEGFAAEKLAVTDIKMEAVDDKGAVNIAIDISGKPEFTSQLTNAGRRLVIDIANTESQGAPAAIVDGVGVVGGLMSQTFSNGSDKSVRILVNLSEDAKYSVAYVGEQLLIRLRAGKSGVLEVKDEKPVTVSKASAVRDVRFEHLEDEDRIIVDTSYVPRYVEQRLTRGRLRLVLQNSTVLDSLERVLDVSAFDGTLSNVATYASKRKAKDVVVEIEPQGKVETRVYKEGNLLIWSFFRPGALPSSVTGVGRDGGVARKSQRIAGDDPLKDAPELDAYRNDEGEINGVEVGGYGSNMFAQNAGNYRGRRIDLDLKDADIHNVLRMLADVGGVNIITADNVTGAVTIRIRNVPWDQALDVVLQSKALGMVRRNNIIRVAPAEDLKQERELAIQEAAQRVQLAPLETRLIPVSYAQAAELQDRVGDMLSNRGTVAIDERTNTLVVRDLTVVLDQVEQLIRALDTQTPQVLVEARIVEASSRYLRDIGIQWGGDASMSTATGNPTGLAFPSSLGIVGGASDITTPTGGLSPFQTRVLNPNFAVNLPATVGTGQGGALGLSLGSIDNNFNLAIRLSAAESSGMLRILSSPRVLTLNNRKARISQGTLIPFSQISAQGVQTTFQEAKLQLLVQPHVTADGGISMQVKINRDEPDFNQTGSQGQPTILKREAETELLIQDGHTAVIGGIYTRNTGRNVDQIPFFGDIPIIGLLFQKRRASDTRSELVIFLTPRIVNRAEALGQ